jgi:hypothetical protein
VVFVLEMIVPDAFVRLITNCCAPGVIPLLVVANVAEESFTVIYDAGIPDVRDARANVVVPPR